MDYDSAKSISYLGRHTSGDNGYKPTRKPGAPVFDIFFAFVYKPFALAGVSPRGVQLYFQWIMWFFAVIVIVLAYLELFTLLPRPAAFLATLSLLLHPLFLWHAWAFAEDIFSLSLCLMGWYAIKKKQDLDAGIILLALGATAKGFGLIYALAALLYIGIQYEPKRFWRASGIFFVLTFFFYAPAFVYYGMEIRTMLATEHYGTSPRDRPSIGWLLARDSLLFYIPIGVALLAEYIPRWKQRNFKLIHSLDAWIILLLPLCVMDFTKFGYRYFLLAISIPYLWRLFKQRRMPEQAQALALWFMVVGTFYMAMSAPYSRSFFLFAIPPLLLLMARRFKTITFWACMAVISYLPMFFYFDLRGKPPYFTMFQRGFYSAHLLSIYHAKHNNEYNDGGLNVTEPLFTIPLGLSHRN